MVDAQQTIFKYYFVGSARIAVRENGTLTWLLSDHLDSTSVTVNAAGALVSRMKYTAFGETRGTASSSTDYRYTGQREEEEIGLYFYKARFYDSALGRFVQPDTVLPNPTNAKYFDRFAYVNNNPINGTDSTGHWVETAFDVISLGMTINDIRNEGFTFWNTVSLITDAASVVIPIVPAGVSHAIRVYKAADKILDTAKTINGATNIVQAANKSDTITDIFKMGDNLPEDEILYQFSRRPGQNGEMRGFPDSLRSGEEGMSCQIASFCGNNPAKGFEQQFGRQPGPGDWVRESTVSDVKAWGGGVKYDGYPGNPNGLPLGHGTIYSNGAKWGTKFNNIWKNPKALIK